jgi:hypothetical protein
MVNIVTDQSHPLDAATPAEMVPTMSDNDSSLLKGSLLYQEFLAEREEILRHKWFQSEKVGHDIGFEKALLDWIVRHRAGWRAARREQIRKNPVG